MSDIDFKKIGNMIISFKVPEVKLNHTLNIFDESNRNFDQVTNLIHDVQEKERAEELRRHNEIIDTLKQAGEKGATIVVGDNANSILIQQNSNSSSQTLISYQGLDYGKAKKVLEEIESYFDFPQFSHTYGETTVYVKKLVKDAKVAIDNNEDEKLIKKSIITLKEISIGVTTSIISSGILALLGTLLK